MKLTVSTAAATKLPFSGHLPKHALTKGGASFDPSADRWAYREANATVSLNFLVFKSFSKSFVEAAKWVLLWYAQNRAPSTLDNAYKALHHFHNNLRNVVTDLVVITDIDLLNYRGTLSKRTLYRFGVLSVFLKQWARMGCAGISSGAQKLMKEIRTPGNPKGEAVLTWDPVEGPLTNIEFEALNYALNDAYADGTLSREKYLLATLFVVFGQRPVQYSSLKVCDLIVAKDLAANPTYSLKMPRAKQGDINNRAQFKERPLIRDLGEALGVHVNAIKVEFEGRLGKTSEAPLFPSRGDADWLPGFEFHRTAAAIGASLENLISNLNIHSERVGGKIPLTAIRLRRTLGTRAAAEGHGPWVIAELFDHADIQQVGVYSANSHAIIRRLGKALAMKIAPLAQAFAGMLIRDESEATRGEDPRSRIIDLRIDSSGATFGSCGQYSFCGFNKPIPCYECKLFQAWLDGPHEAVLDYLLAERKRLMKTTDATIASILDRSILAVAEVVRRVNVQYGRANG